MDARMQSAVEYIRQNHITGKFEIIKVLMERAEKLSTDGPTKKRLVLEAYMQLMAQDSQATNTLGVIPMTTIEMIIDAFIFATKSAMDFNKRTNCWSTLTAMCKKNTTV